MAKKNKVVIIELVKKRNDKFLEPMYEELGMLEYWEARDIDGVLLFRGGEVGLGELLKNAEIAGIKIKEKKEKKEKLPPCSVVVYGVISSNNLEYFIDASKLLDGVSSVVVIHHNTIEIEGLNIKTLEEVRNIALSAFYRVDIIIRYPERK